MNLSYQKIDIKNLSQPQLVSWLANRSIQSFHANQILKWIYSRQTDSFEDMTDLGKETRLLLSGNFIITRNQMVCKEISTDGSVKYLFRLQDGKNIESVLIPEKDHYTLCISSQVGCAQGCRFCLTGQAGFGRNLTSGEIIAQIRDIQYEITKNRKPCKPLTNIVFMGMGEPLANYRNVLAAIDIITDEQIGLRFSTRRVTLSTAGLVPRLYDLSRDTQVNLAVSLNAVDNETRSRLMPINKTYPLESLISACRNYPVQPRRRITFEYVLLKGLNDSPEDAKRLAELLRPIRAKINLIPFNEYAGSEFRRPDEPAVEIFRDILIKRNYTAIVRHSKGRDISAACGQLSAGGKAGVISSNAVHPPAGFPGRL